MLDKDMKWTVYYAVSFLSVFLLCCSHDFWLMGLMLCNLWEAETMIYIQS